MRESSRHTVGLVLERASLHLSAEPFYHEFIAGAERVLSPAGLAVVLTVVASADAEVETYRRWSAEGTVDAILLVDLARHDARVPALVELAMPTVVVGDPETAGPFPAVWTNDRATMTDALTRLKTLGHRSVGRVSGPRKLAHSQIRSETFAAMCAALALTCHEAVAPYTEEGGAEATAELMAHVQPPSVIIYDDDLMALGGVGQLARTGVSVPEQVSVLAWDDSVLCQLCSPRLAALGHDVQAIGERAGVTVIALLRDGVASTVEAPQAELVVRESLGSGPEAGD